MSGETDSLLLNHGQRPDLDRALAGRAFLVDQLACSAGARVLTALRLENGSNQSHRILKDELLYRISLAAVCHQMNWDFLGQRLSGAFDRERLDARALSEVTARDIRSWLDGYNKPERVRANERAALLRDVGEVLQQAYSGDVLRLFEDVEGRLQGPGGLLESLDRFKAFREDPLRKKTNVLVHEVVRDGLVRFVDEDRIDPAVDYHIMRLYLRTGRVVPLHKDTLEMLKRDSFPRPRLIRLLREAVSEAISLTALYADLSVPIVNSIEWQLGRDICDRIRPRCTDVDTAVSGRLGLAQNRCPNAEYCLAFGDPDWRALREPDHTKSFY